MSLKSQLSTGPLKDGLGDLNPSPVLDFSLPPEFRPNKFTCLHTQQLSYMWLYDTKVL